MPTAPINRGSIRATPATHRAVARLKRRIGGASMDETLRVLMVLWDDLSTVEARNKAIAKVRMPKGGAA